MEKLVNTLFTSFFHAPKTAFKKKKAAENCGFKDYSVFYKAYVKRFGEKPSSIGQTAAMT